MRNHMVLPASGTFNAQRQVLTNIFVLNFSKKPTTLLEGMLFGVSTDIPEIIVHLDKGASIRPKEWNEEDESIKNPVQFYSTQN